MLVYIVALCQFFALFGALAWGVVGWTGVDPVRGLFGSYADSVKIIIGCCAHCITVSLGRPKNWQRFKVGTKL